MSQRFKLHWVGLLSWQYGLNTLIWIRVIYLLGQPSFSDIFLSFPFLSLLPLAFSSIVVATTTQKINKNQAKHWISRRSLIVPFNYKGSYSLVFGQSVSYRNTDNFSYFDIYIDFQCILFRQAFQTGLSTFLLFWG